MTNIPIENLSAELEKGRLCKIICWENEFVQPAGFGQDIKATAFDQIEIFLIDEKSLIKVVPWHSIPYVRNNQRLEIFSLACEFGNELLLISRENIV